MSKLIKTVDEYIREKQYRLINGILVYKDDAILFERYYNHFTPETGNNIKSIWKSILSICTGICLDKGLIKSLDDPICAYLDEFAQGEHSYHKFITVRHLLTMRSGIYWNGGIHYHCPMLEQLWSSENCLEQLAQTRMRDFPGRVFVYKEWDVILLSALIGQASGMGAYAFCDQFLYKPLGIHSKEWASLSAGARQVNYSISPELSLETQSDLCARDLARIGLLLFNEGKINKGKADEQQIVSQAYLQQALSAEANPSYGFLFWLFEDGFACRGFGGQSLTIVPKENLIFVLQATPTARSKDYGAVFDFIREQINGREGNET